MRVTRDNVVELFRATLTPVETVDFEECDAATQFTIACEEMDFDPDAVPVKRRTWGERYRKAFIDNATARGFINVRFVEENGKCVVYCDSRRGKGDGPMDPKTEVIIGRWAPKMVEKGGN